ncbi:MAG TPA: Fic family protein [Terracidiphilus sp.]|nr:Fic family protein [Terracidiphilus sp.]
MIKYKMPEKWIHYDRAAILGELAEAKGAILALKTIPFQRRWVEALQAMQLKLEVAGTSKIEGADFSGVELEIALRETPEQLITRSQRQAHAAMQTYKWIPTIPNDRPITKELICEFHRRIITGADDDHCAPGVPRGRDHNVTFGVPPHRGAEGGNECEAGLSNLVDSIQKGFGEHDNLVQALALHYHFAAMHPFADGNGRTARALESLFLQRAGMRDSTFIAMSNYYYDEKKRYLESLAAVRQLDFDLTPFLKFALKGIALQSQRLADEISRHVRIEVYRGLIHDLFGRLRTPRKRVIAKRQIAILEHLLTFIEADWFRFYGDCLRFYTDVQNPGKALLRDVNHLITLGTIGFRQEPGPGPSNAPIFSMWARLDWPSEITETEFFQKLSSSPRAKGTLFMPR